jgi:SAM-dependent methyltransferase
MDVAVERYCPDSQEWWELSADHLARYLFAIQYVTGRRVLDAGTGYGYGAAILAASGATAVFAIDIDPNVVCYGRRAYQLPNLTIEVDDCEHLDKAQGAFDVIINFENIEHLKDPRAFLRAAARLFARDGILLCSTPDRAAMAPFVNAKPANPYHVNEWYTDEFGALLREFFNEVQIYAQVRSVPAELRQNGAEEVQRFLRENIALKGYRFLSRLVGRRPFTPSAYLIGTPDPSDFPIYPHAIAKLFGKMWCNIAICRQPRATV